MNERIKELRRILGLKQREFADALGVKTGAVGAWESGSFKPGAARIELICERFKVSREWLINGAGPVFKEDSETAPPQASAVDEARLEAFKVALQLLPRDVLNALRAALDSLD